MNQSEVIENWLDTLWGRALDMTSPDFAKESDYIKAKNNYLKHSKADLLKLISESSVKELETIKEEYAESYQRIAEELQTTRKTPHTAFHVIIDQHISKLSSTNSEAKKGGDND